MLGEKDFAQRVFFFVVNQDPVRGEVEESAPRGPASVFLASELLAEKAALGNVLLYV